jgi:hypothetical protein
MFQVGLGIGLSIISLCGICCFYSYVRRRGGCLENENV